MSQMTIKALAPWYGANRVLAATAGVQLGRCDWVGVPFAGGCCELPHIKTRAGIANDLHRHLINLARVVRDRNLKAALAEKLAGTLFHADELTEAQARCRDREAAGTSALFGEVSTPASELPDLAWAFDYFVCCWMGRSAAAGKRTEFGAYFSVRWTSSGGDSATRFRSAVESLESWHRALLPWNFTTIDAFEFIENAKDQKGHGLYSDAPWPDDGIEYRHRFTDADQRRLADRLGRFKATRVVVRFGDHPFIRELYPEDRWTWVRQSSRSQANGEVSEVLILNGPSFTQETA